MSKLVSMGICPYCNKGHNTPCFAEFTNGYHCYSCGRHKHVTDDFYAFKDPRLISQDTKYPLVSKDINKFSINVLQWLYKYHVFERLIRKYKIFYSKEKEDSLIFNVIKDNKITFWQQRYFPSKRFKTGGNKNELFFISNPQSTKLVLVEDFISAIRVGELANVICLWGTCMNKDVSNFIKNISICDIKIWLDPDIAGQNAAKTVKNNLIRLLKYDNIDKAFAILEQRTVNILTSEKQPKEYTDSEIKTILETQ